MRCLHVSLREDYDCRGVTFLTSTIVIKNISRTIIQLQPSHSEGHELNERSIRYEELERYTSHVSAVDKRDCKLKYFILHPNVSVSIFSEVDLWNNGNIKGNYSFRRLRRRLMFLVFIVYPHCAAYIDLLWYSLHGLLLLTFRNPSLLQLEKPNPFLGNSTAILLRFWNKVGFHSAT